MDKPAPFQEKSFGSSHPAHSSDPTPKTKKRKGASDQQPLGIQPLPLGTGNERKVVVVGSTGVGVSGFFGHLLNYVNLGKTCFCIYNTYGKWPDVCTVFDNHSLDHKHKDEVYKVMLWDTAGSEDCMSFLSPLRFFSKMFF